MKAAFVQDGTVRVGEVADPVPGQGQALVRTHACGLCASDAHFLAIMQGNEALTTPPQEGSRPSMATEEKKIRRTLHFKFTITGASEQMVAMIKSAAPLYQMFGDAQVRLLQNVDDPGRFLQEIAYDAPETLEQNRQQIASDPRVQAYLMGWRAMFPGAIEIEVYKLL